MDFQLHNDTANPSIKKIARQNPDKKWAKVELEVPQDEAETRAIDKKKGEIEEEREAAKKARDLEENCRSKHFGGYRAVKQRKRYDMI